MTPTVPRMVMHRTMDPNRQYNGKSDHPAVVTGVLGENQVNLHVLPDCGPAYTVSHQQLIDPANETAHGWFWPTQAR